MAHIDKGFRARCEQEPDRRVQVVITLYEGRENAEASDLGIDGAEKIGSLGILKASVTGDKVLELLDRDEIEDISPDFEAGILAV